MSYILDQFVQQAVGSCGILDNRNTKYMTPITEGASIASERANCLYLSSKFSLDKNYYFHAKIQKKENEQIFHIYLVKKSGYSDANEKKQFLKTFKVPAASGTSSKEWADVELVFTPYISNFDSILFELQGGNNSNTIIVYEELDEINNIVGNGIAELNAELTKIEVQSLPGLSMVINNENIYVGGNGVYKTKDNMILINSFSVVKAATEDPFDSQTFEEYLNTLTESVCILDHSKKRSINAYIIDYVYNEED